MNGPSSVHGGGGQAQEPSPPSQGPRLEIEGTPSSSITPDGVVVLGGADGQCSRGGEAEKQRPDVQRLRTPDQPEAERIDLPRVSEGRKAAQLRITKPNEREVIQKALADFEVPVGFVRCEVPPQHPNRSIIYDYGVRVMTVDDPALGKKRKYRWHCMATDECIEHEVSVGVSATATTNASDHLKDHHGTTSNNSKAKHSSKEAHNQQVLKMTGKGKGHSQPVLRDTDPPRFHALNYVRSFTIGEYAPYEQGEHKMPRVFFATSCLPEFPVKGLHHKRVRHYLVEYFVGLRQQQKKEFAAARASGARFTITVDLWDEVINKRKYCGARVTWVDKNGNVKSRLIAARHFNPSSAERDTMRIADLLYYWVMDCLAEVGLGKDDLFACTSDHGADVLAALTNQSCFGLLSEWCGSHMINRALTDSFGYCEDPAKSRNVDSRTQIFTMRQVANHIRASPVTNTTLQELQLKEWGKTLKLKSMDLRRWSSADALYSSLLCNLDLICRTYYYRAKDCPLRNQKKAMLQQYSILHSAHLASKAAQGNGCMSGPLFMLQMVELLDSGALDTSTPLTIIDPKTGEPMRDEMGNVVTVQHENLEPVARTTRDLLCKGLVDRFVDGRYSGELKGSLLWDAAATAHPAYSGRTWVNGFAYDEDSAQQKRVEILSVLVDVVEAVLRDRQRRSESSGGDADSSGGGVSRTTERAGSRSGGAAGISRFGKSGAQTSRPATVSLRDRAKQLVGAYMAWCDSDDAPTTELSWAQIPYKWATEWQQRFPEMWEAFRWLMSVTAGAAQIERDFSSASNLVTSRRTRLDAAFVEMTLLLHLNGHDVAAFDGLPSFEKIPILTELEVKAAVPRRFTDPQLFADYLALDFFQVHPEDEEDEEEAMPPASWSVRPQKKQRVDTEGSAASASHHLTLSDTSLSDD